jgi:N-acetylmuramoyl-L-alanine amidase CwlA
MNKRLLTPNQYSRPMRKLLSVRSIVLHWFMVPKQTAAQVREYWERRKDGGGGYGSAHIIIDNREAILAVPINEMAYHVGSDNYTDFAERHIGNYPNAHTIGIELAHSDMTGKPTPDVWERAISVVANLANRFDIPEHMVVTHWDVTGMRPHWHNIPDHRWFVEQPGELARFRSEVAKARGRT